MEFDVKWLIGAALVVVFVLLLFALRAGWRAKGRAQADVPPPPSGDAVRGDLVARFDDVHYVATTLDERPLERVVADPLAFRGRCDLEVRTDGVRVAIRGTESFAIPASAIDAIGARTATIDRAVERDGLTVVSWRLGAGAALDVPVHTSFRVVDRAERTRFDEALDALAPAPSAPLEENR